MDQDPFEAARLQHLIADLKLTPAERLQRLEELRALSDSRRPRGADQIIAFDCYDDFYDWKARQRIVIR